MEGLAKQLFDILSFVEVNQLKFGYFPDKGHGDVLHLAVYDAFSQLFDVVKQ